MSTKKPRLFYWEDTIDAWASADGLSVADLVCIDADPMSTMDDGEELSIRFLRRDMTDAEYDAIPEG